MIDKPGLTQFFVNSVPFLVLVLPVIIGNKVMKTEIFKVFRPFKIVGAKKVVQEDVFAVGIKRFYLQLFSMVL